MQQTVIIPMKAFNHPHTKIKSKLKAFVSFSVIRELASDSGFCSRAARKIDPVSFVLSFFLCCAAGKSTLNNWVSQLSMLDGRASKDAIPTRQAICKRLTDLCSFFLEGLLARLLVARISKDVSRVAGKANNDKRGGGLLSSFSSVLIQDSTTITLPKALNIFFKGSVSCGVTKAVARIQCILDIKTMAFRHFQLGSFCENDQSAVSLIHHLVKEKTLVLRDMGYCVLRSFREIERRQGYFLSRIKFGISLFDQQGQRLALKNLLSSINAPTSFCVRLGEKEQLPVRLIIIPLSAKVAAERRRRAKTDRDRRLNHSKEYMNALGYQILITNVTEDIWSPEQAAEVYRLRWGIESLFKGFKSAGLHMHQLCSQIRTNGERARSTLLLALCFITIQVMMIYRVYAREIQLSTHGIKKKGDQIYCRGLSLLKMMDWLRANFLFWLNAPPNLRTLYFKSFCCYDIRTDRINAYQQRQHALA